MALRPPADFAPAAREPDRRAPLPGAERQGRSHRPRAHGRGHRPDHALRHRRPRRARRLPPQALAHRLRRFTGPAAEAPIPHDTTPPAAPQELRPAGSTSRWVDKLNLRWRNIVDHGSPIDTARYQLLDPAGNPLGAAQALNADNVQAIDAIDAPARRCACAVRVWLTDAEGNVGAPARVPLTYECARSPVGGGSALTASPSADTVAEGQDLALTGALRQSSGAPVAGAPLCVFEQVEGAATSASPTPTRPAATASRYRPAPTAPCARSTDPATAASSPRLR